MAGNIYIKSLTLYTVVLIFILCVIGSCRVHPNYKSYTSDVKSSEHKKYIFHIIDSAAKSGLVNCKPVGNKMEVSHDDGFEKNHVKTECGYCSVWLDSNKNVIRIIWHLGNVY
jgi:hypothetical protein